MNELVATRVVETTDGQWIAQYQESFGWNQLGDPFPTEAQAQEFLDDQIDSADTDAY